MKLGNAFRFLLMILVISSLVGWGAHQSMADSAPPAGSEHGESDHGHAAANGHSTGEHAAGGHASEPNPLVFATDLAIWTVVVFVVLLAVLKKFAWGPISEALHRREQGIADNIAAAERQNVEAKRLLGEYEQRLAQASNQVREILEEARRDAEHTKAEILSEAKAAAQAEQDRSLREIRNATDGALKQLAETSAHLAVDLAGKVLSERLQDVDHTRLVRDALGRFPERVDLN